MSVSRAVNVTLDSYGIVICLILMLYLCMSDDKDKRLNRYFTMMCFFGLAMQLGDIANWTCEGKAHVWQPFLLETGTYLYYISSAFLLLFYTLYLIRYLHSRIEVSKLYWYASVFLGGLSVALSTVSAFNGIYYDITPDNRYVRGEYFWLSQAIPLLMYGINCAIVVTYRRYMDKKEVRFFTAYIFFPILAEAVQILFYGWNLLCPAVTVALLLVFINIQLKREIQARVWEKEAADSRIDIMLTQIQPHFLYNVLVVIRQLCDINPALAKEAVSEFASFLRGNMAALTRKGLIPFEQELKHVENYLRLEQKRFGSRLTVIYDIRVREFELPPLTLQPLVENAVRHGIMKMENGGTVIIRTEEREDSFIISVEDDGIGITEWKEEENKGEHIGIKNVQNRIKAMCMGRLEILSSQEKGCTVMIIIPKEEV